MDHSREESDGKNLVNYYNLIEHNRKSSNSPRNRKKFLDVSDAEKINGQINHH